MSAEQESRQRTGQQRPLDWVNVIFMCSTPVIAIGGTVWYALARGITRFDVAIFLLMYLATGLSITGGYHRYFSHRTYDCSRPLQLFYLLFGAAAVQNSAINWCSEHRYHHRYVDTDADPYNILRGGLYAHIGWIFYKDTRDKTLRYKNVPDLLKDPLAVWQDKHYLAIVGAVGFAFPALLGALGGRALGGLLLGGLLRCVVVHHMTFFINSLAHLYGERPYSDTDTARDSWWLGVFTFGEGYHNFHHKFQFDYRNGLRWYQFDITKWWLWALRPLGQARRFRQAPEPAILKARLAVQARAIALQLAGAKPPEPLWERVQAQVEAGRARLENAYAQVRQARLEQRRRKEEWTAEMRRQWKARLKQHQEELESARRRWAELRKGMVQLSSSAPTT